MQAYAVQLSGYGLPSTVAIAKAEGGDLTFTLSIHPVDVENISDDDFPLFRDTPVAECEIGVGKFGDETRLLFSHTVPEVA